MAVHRKGLCLAFLGVFGALNAAELRAQTQKGNAARPLVMPATPMRAYETREQLEALAWVAESERRTADVRLLRTRLDSGDFQEGDRIVVVLESNPTSGDTLQVRAGKVLQLSRMADLSLEGVLRSELDETLRRHLATYLTNPGVRATPLLPIAVLGNVGSPGFYYAAADVVLRDVIMRAGGPRDADLNKVVVRRGGQTIWNHRDVRVAISDGHSLDRLHLRAGDEIFVPPRRKFPLANVLAIATTGMALTVTLMQVRRD